ncbi:hypothetical protein P170DRAFT_477511 [Aspergillus steynii IBT 23096]|uniref:Uncharacterized protein n=1 Tax=Aspergillus steynii IBT 23096 TaxID=1392250 RepID=A0A2I2G180_9EURO|nr:uncharacterized protein P170DRAFT_477511 [Aspergillus steynii IBT 23096]PLB46635.1 hypothetical protein P170DRAFT_477511 [Aspergillus steynii IBT 23096]
MRSNIISTLLLATTVVAGAHSPVQQRSAISTDDIPVVNLVTGLLKALNIDADVTVDPDNLVKHLSQSQKNGLATYKTKDILEFDIPVKGYLFTGFLG